VAQADWLKLGFVLSVYYLAVWGGCAMTVWKALGIW
jgi:di/tricarboxylate transporter